MPNFGFSVDTAANWKSVNPTPVADELCVERDTGQMKLGDGSTAYNTLAYLGGTAGSVLIAKTELITTYGNTSTNAFSQTSGTYNPVGQVTFTAPQSGKVQFRVNNVVFGSVSYYYSLSFGSSSGGSQYGISNGITPSQSYMPVSHDMLVTGLTPGSSYTVYLGGYCSNGTIYLYSGQLEVYSA